MNKDMSTGSLVGFELLDDEDTTAYDNLILHKYMHPVEQFMIEEDFQFFNEHFDKQILHLLDDIMKQ
jgi:hypothetical protein